MLARTPPPPYYAVIFASTRTDGDDGYAATAARMVELAERQPGFLGVDSARDAIGITVSYWADEASIAAWKAEAEHTLARDAGRARCERGLQRERAGLRFDIDLDHRRAP